MGAVSYPNAKVSAFVAGELIPLQVPSDGEDAVAFGVSWTPTLAVLDPEGKERHRSVGFLEPDELIAFLMLGMAKVDAGAADLAQAIARLDTLLAEYPASAAVPQAIFERGVCRFKHEQDPQALKGAWTQLSQNYPGSEWAKKAQPYSLL